MTPENKDDDEQAPCIEGETGEILEGRASSIVSQALVPRSEVVSSLMTPAEALAEWQLYLDLCNAVLGPDDYQRIGRKHFKKKSAWRKLAKFYAISDRLPDGHPIVERDERGRPIFASCTVEAWDRKTGRSAIGYHEAHLGERCCPTAQGDPCSKSAWDSHACCTPNCDGWPHWSHPGDLVATAHTRAKNRAIADLIGAGEVSAEEMEGADQSRSPSQSPQRRPPPPAPARPAGSAQPRQRRRTPNELKAEAEAIAERKPWKCGRCETGVLLHSTERNCPKCGHLRGARADPPAKEAVIDAEVGVIAIDVTPGQSRLPDGGE